MSTNGASHEREIFVDQQTINRQKTAADPLLSAWVSANAGSGKTYVLSTRVMRLLLEGVDPSKILCLTYTKAAAAEMKTRVFSRLSAWVTMKPEELARSLSEITGKRASEAQLKFARTLFAGALETPGGLKVQTIHAFCEALLHRFPLEANIAGHFELIDEVESGFLIAQARRTLLTGQNREIQSALARVLARSGEAGLEKLLNEIIAKRQMLGDLILSLGEDPERRKAYFEAFGFAQDASSTSLEQAIWRDMPFDMEALRAARDEAAASGKARSYEFAYGLIVALENQNQLEAFSQLKDCLLKKDNSPYKADWVFAKNIAEKFPDLLRAYDACATLMAEISGRANLLEEINKTLDALSIADRFISLYSTLKNQRGLLDFEDLIARTQSMLLRDNVAAWVRYKLDQGIDHLLVDEAQDTSPAQWQVIKTLADEFFEGESAASEKRTIFAVGDEKQSIYSFQGADPRGFDEQRLHFSVKVKNADRGFKDLRLNTSFRSTQDILSAVDLVFAPEENRRGLTPEGGPFPPHISLRSDQPGLVQIWEPVQPELVEEEEDWREPVDHASKPAIVLAERVATQIKNWLDGNELLQASGKPINAGDILVLVRKRDAFVHALSRALKNRRIPVAGADRLSMVGHIAILDLMALGKIMLNTCDDLSLAALLRSPVFGWSDEQLFALGHGRESQSLYARLADKAASEPDAAEAYTQLEKWRTIARQKPVFEFYSHVLSVCGVRQKLISRLGRATSEMLDEFLSFAIAQERTGTSSLETFLHTLERYSPEIKREMDEAGNEVRIMTVHGAKGLEAPVVFLIDPGSAAFISQNAPMLLPLELEQGQRKLQALLWGNSSTERSTESGNILEKLKQSAEDEYRRLLYVGMTRAADRLIIAGYQGKRANAETWHQMVSESLQNECRELVLDGFSALQYPAQQKLPIKPAMRTDAMQSPEQTVVPDCFAEPVLPEPPAARPLIPSGAYGFAVEASDHDSDAETNASLLPSDTEIGSASDIPHMALKRGTATHKLLQMLPDVEPDARRSKAEAYCRNIEQRWDQADIAKICDQVMNVLEHPEFAHFFSQDAQAEVSVMGTLKIGDEDRAISGVIDRLVATQDAVYLLDYKTNANPPRSVAEIPDVYLRQMAIYQALVAPLYPGKPVIAALLFTAKPELFVLDEPLLQRALASFAPAA